MRRRYAVLSALANQDWTPEDEQHIGYFRPDNCGMDFQKLVSFEWWASKDDKKKVLILWVDESSMSRNPAEKLEILLNQTNPKTPT